jgi:biopolymer transport protein ExbD
MLHYHKEEEQMHRRAIPSYAGPVEAPISELNTTPLIDVMLVLLIMFIVTVPIASHKVPLDLPQDGPASREPTVHRLDLDAAGRIRLDGLAVSDAELPARLKAIAAEPLGELHLRTDGETRYERFDSILAAIRRAGVERLGMVDNEKFVPAIG